MASQLIASIAAVGLLGSGLVAATETRSYAVLPALTATTVADGQGAGGEKCRVDVVREGLPGEAAITRQVLDNGDCVCTIRTGPASNNGSAESIVVALLRDRECAGAPLAYAPGSSGAGAGGAGGAGGGGGGLGAGGAAALGGLALAGGLAVGLSKKSPG